MLDSMWVHVGVVIHKKKQPLIVTKSDSALYYNNYKGVLCVGVIAILLKNRTSLITQY